MVFEEKSMKDKLGRTIVFRNAIPEDAGDLIKYLKITSAETHYLIREPEESTITKPEEEQFIQARIDADCSRSCKKCRIRAGGAGSDDREQRCHSFV